MLTAFSSSIGESHLSPCQRLFFQGIGCNTSQQILQLAAKQDLNRAQLAVEDRRRGREIKGDLKVLGLRLPASFLLRHTIT